MSQEVIDGLERDLKSAVDQANGFVMQLDGHKGFITELVTSNLNLRTSLISANKLIQQNNQEFQKCVKELADAKFLLADNERVIGQLQAALEAVNKGQTVNTPVSEPIYSAV